MIFYDTFHALENLTFTRLKNRHKQPFFSLDFDFHKNFPMKL